jgi:hypothetical protein
MTTSRLTPGITRRALNETSIQVLRMKATLFRGRAHAVVRRGPFLRYSDPLLLLRPPTTFHPILKSHSTSPDPPQAGHAPVPPHLSQSPWYPASTATPTSTPVPPHALHLPPPPHSVQGFDGAAIMRVHSALRTSSISGCHSRFHEPPRLRQPAHLMSTYQRAVSPSWESSHPVLRSHSPQAGHSLRRPSSFSL